MIRIDPSGVSPSLVSSSSILSSLLPPSLASLPDLPPSAPLSSGVTKKVRPDKYCVECGKSVKASSWSRHSRTKKHLKMPLRKRVGMHECPYCGTSHASKQDLCIHKKITHPEILKVRHFFECRACCVQVRDKHDAFRHLRTGYHILNVIERFPECLHFGTTEIDPEKAWEMMVEYVPKK